MKHYLKYSQWVKLLMVCAMVNLIITGCTKETKLYSPDEGKLYMPQAVDGAGELHFYRIDSVQYFYFGASVAGFKGATQNTNLSFEIDTNLIAQFNEDHAYLAYNFRALPDSAFKVSGFESSINKSVSDSKPLTVSVMVNKLDPYTDYCLPIKIKSFSAGKLDTAMSVGYFFIDSLYIRSRYIQGKLTVSKDNNGGANAKEGSVRLNDNDLTTKFLFDFEDNSWMQLKLDSAQKLNAYELTSGNDASERDPKDWQFQGSNNGSDWTTLDEHHDYVFYNRSTTVRFEYKDPDNKDYLYYRLLVEHTNGSNLFQMTEWRLLQYY